MSQKVSDFDTIPLCRQHHTEQHRIGWKDFIRSYDLDVRGLLTALREKPVISVVKSGFPPFPPFLERCYMATYRGQQFTLRRVDDGLKASLDCAYSVCREYLIEDLFLKGRAA